MERLAKLRDSQTFRSRMLAILFTFGLFALCMSVAVTPVAAATNDTGAGTVYFGLTIIDWVFAGLAVALLVIYFIMKNPFEFIGFLIVLALLVVMYVMGY